MGDLTPQGFYDKVIEAYNASNYEMRNTPFHPNVLTISMSDYNKLFNAAPPAAFRGIYDNRTITFSGCRLLQSPDLQSGEIIVSYAPLLDDTSKS